MDGIRLGLLIFAWMAGLIAVLFITEWLVKKISKLLGKEYPE